MTDQLLEDEKEKRIKMKQKFRPTIQSEFIELKWMHTWLLYNNRHTTWNAYFCRPRRHLRIATTNISIGAVDDNKFELMFEFSLRVGFYFCFRSIVGVIVCSPFPFAICLRLLIFNRSTYILYWLDRLAKSLRQKCWKCLHCFANIQTNTIFIVIAHHY